MSLPNLSGLSRMQRALDIIPEELQQAILQASGAELGAQHMCPFVEQECERSAPWLDCTKDSTWRMLAINVFGGPNVDVQSIDRWMQERDGYRNTQAFTTLTANATWKQVFGELCHCYGIMYRAFKYNSKGYSVMCSPLMMGVFPRFYEFPGYGVRLEKVEYGDTVVRRLKLFRRQ